MIGLIDIDSKIPNLALMKLSAWHKQQGDRVNWYKPLFDNPIKIYASKIFDFSNDYQYFPNCEIVRGGSAYDISIKLPNYIEHIYPDYSLYNCDYAIGYTSRGCNRRCPFCIVPQKEGKWEITSDIYEFWNGQEKLMLLDNSLNTNENHFSLILNQLIKEKIKVDFNQGLDIRLLTDKQAYLLSKVRLWKQIHFAWDWIHIEDQVIKGIEILTKYNLKYKSMFYVLIGFNTTQQEDLYRVEKLRDLGIDPFVMPFDKSNQYQKNFTRWVNHKAIFKSVKWEDYKK